jgi:hypothetical protein
LKYHGKGDPPRAAASAKRVAAENGDVATGISHEAAATERQSFKDEATRLEKDGGPGQNNYNKINSPGKKMKEEDGD